MTTYCLILGKRLSLGTTTSYTLMGPLFQGSNNLGDNDKRSLEEESLLSSLEEKGTPVAFTQVELSERRVSRVAEIRVSFVEDKTMLKEEHISFECN